MIKSTRHCPWVLTAVVIAASGIPFVARAQEESTPEAIFTLTPDPPRIGEIARVDASLSFDRPIPGNITAYQWNWGDQTPITTGVTSAHIYNAAGRYTITLTVVDNVGNRDSATKTVNVAAPPPPPDGENHPPTAALIISPLEVFVGDIVTYDARGSHDADSDPLTYRFSFGDGEETGFQTDDVVQHEYVESGSYVVRLTVRDDSNASSDITGSVRVLDEGDNQAPVAIIATGPRSGAAPLTLEFDGTVSYDPDGDPLAYFWTFSSGDQVLATQTGSRVSQLFSQPGTYTVVLEVNDPAGASGVSEEVTLTVTARGEPVEPPPPAPTPEPEPPPPSYTQRPPSVCGVGMIMAALGSMLGLAVLRLGRFRIVA